MRLLEGARVAFAALALVDEGGVEAVDLLGGGGPAGELDAGDVVADAEVEERDLVAREQ